MKKCKNINQNKKYFGDRKTSLLRFQWVKYIPVDDSQFINSEAL